MKLSNLKRALSLIVTVALIAGLAAMPVFAEDSCATSASVGVPVVDVSKITKTELGDGSVELESSGGNPVLYLYTTVINTEDEYTFGTVEADSAKPTFVKTEFTLNRTAAINNFAATGGNQSWSGGEAGVATNYAFIANLQTKKCYLYANRNGGWVKDLEWTDTADKYRYLVIRFANADAGTKLATISNPSETIYTGEWDINRILFGDKIVKYPTPSGRNVVGTVANVSEGSWKVTGNEGLGLPLTGLKGYDANDYKTNYDPTAAFIKTEATINANGGKFGTLNFYAMANGSRMLTQDSHFGNGSTLGDGFDLGRDYIDSLKVTAIFDIAAGKFYIYGSNIEPKVYSILGGTYNLKVWEGDATIDNNEPTGYMLVWNAGGSNIDVTDYKQTTYYDTDLTLADVIADGEADIETLAPAFAGVGATATKSDSTTWTITTTDANAEVKMLSGYYGPEVGYVATEVSRNYANFVHYSATLKVTAGTYEGYKLNAVRGNGTYVSVAPIVYGTNGLPALNENEAYKLDMIYDCATGHTYAYVNDVLCEDRVLSSDNQNFGGFSLEFTGVTDAVTAVVTNPSLKYYNKSGAATLNDVATGLDNNGIKLNYKSLADGTAKAQFYGNLADESFVIAVYEGNVLKSATMEEFLGAAQVIVKEGVTDGQTVKVFVWDTETLAPVLPVTPVQ